jgi:hypothetical protein
MAALPLSKASKLKNVLPPGKSFFRKTQTVFAITRTVAAVLETERDAVNSKIYCLNKE